MVFVYITFLFAKTQLINDGLSTATERDSRLFYIVELNGAFDRTRTYIVQNCFHALLMNMYTFPCVEAPCST